MQQQSRYGCVLVLFYFTRKPCRIQRTNLDSHSAPGAAELLISDCQQMHSCVHRTEHRGTREDHTSVPCRHSPHQQPPLGPKPHRGDGTTSGSLHSSTGTACSSWKSNGISSTFPQELLQEVSFAAAPLMFTALTTVSPTYMLFGSPQL